MLVGDKAEHVRRGKVFREFARVRLSPSPGQETLSVKRELRAFCNSGTDTADLAGLDLAHAGLCRQRRSVPQGSAKEISASDLQITQCLRPNEYQQALCYLQT